MMILQSYLHFLGKLCDCKSLHWSFSDKRSCDGKFSVEFTILLPNTHIYNQTVDIALCNMSEFYFTTAIEFILTHFLDLFLEYGNPYAHPEARHGGPW